VMVCSCALMFKFFSMPQDGATIQYEMSNRGFSDFLRAYYCDFLNVYRCVLLLLRVIGPAGIAVPRIRHCF